MNTKVLAVSVCYNPDPHVLASSVKALVEQGCHVLLVDNGSFNVDEIKQLQLGQADDCSLLEMGGNQGLGAAHNAGIMYAQRNQFDFVLIMDQDSVPLCGMVENLLKAYARKKQRSALVSAVGVTYINSDNGNASFFVRFGKLKFQRHYCSEQDGDGCIEADFLISSGSLVALEAISKIGLMDESLFIDHVDTEWFLRAKDKGFNAYGVCNAKMQHGLGEQTHEITLGGRKRNVPQHKPFRYFYIFRNSVLLYRRQYVNNLWKWNDLQRLLMILIMFGLIKSPRRANFSMMLKGLWHGIRGKAGQAEHV